jgi:hypothetical protein
MPTGTNIGIRLSGVANLMNNASTITVNEALEAIIEADNNRH